MSILSDIRKQQRLREAEGYLDLIFVLADRWPVSSEHRHRLGQRVLESLQPLDSQDRFCGTVNYMRGLALRAMEAYDEAIHALAYASKLEPDNFHIQLALGWCYKRVDRLDLAIESLQDAEELAPDEAIIQYNLACYWSLVNNKDRALFHLSRSIELDPDYRDKVAGEGDFDPIRQDPEFRLLSSIIV